MAASGAPMLSMPCAEAFGALLVTMAVFSHLGPGCCDAVTSVLDCRPAARAYTSAFSASAQIRSLLYRARAVCPHWLGVPVPREWNSDADRLSHPSLVSGVISDARSRGLRVVTLPPPPVCWDTLAEASRLPIASNDLLWEVD